MTLDTFIKRHHVELSPGVLSFCKKSLNIMSKSVDPLHDTSHIYGILSNLDQFITSTSEVNWKKVNFEILLLAICWHDTWKSQRRANNGHRLVYYQLAEGIGSMRLFSREARKSGLDEYLIKKVRYAIRKHSMIQFLPTRSLETKILKDMDKLEEWSTDRLKRGIGIISNWKDISPKLVTVGRFYLKHWLIPRANRVGYFAWTRSELKSRKDPFIREAMKSLQNITYHIINP